jgi:ABC-type transport system involved in multi-copper enzyme maturation permease subunit
MNGILSVARQDLRQAFRDRLLWAATVLLGAMFLPSVSTVASPERHPPVEAMLLLALDLVTFMLVVVAAVGYGAVVSERVAGTVRFVLGLPATRRDVMAGKLLSRVAVVGVVLGSILTITAVFVVRGYGTSSLTPFLVMAGWLIVYSAVWTAVTVGYSAAFDSGYQTLGALVVTYVTFSFDFGVWSALVRPMFAFVFTGSLESPTYESLATAPLWLRGVERLNPLVNFWQAMRWSVEAVGPGSATGEAFPQVIGTALFVLFGAVILAWGTRRFERTDLGGETGGLTFKGWIRRAVTGMASRFPGTQSGMRDSTSRTRTVASADRRHALQNWIVLASLAVTVLFVGPTLWQSLGPSSVSTLTDQLADIPPAFNLPLLVLGIAMGYGAVTGERAENTARFVLSLPATRRELVLGELRSRVTLVVGVLLVVVLLAEGLVVARLGGVYPRAALAWGAYVLVFGAVWTSAVVGFSAIVSTRYRTLALAFGTYFLFSRGIGLWDLVVRPLFTLVFAGTTEWDDYAFAADGGPLWFRYADHLNPFVALDTLGEGLLAVAGYSTQFADPTIPIVCYSLLVLASFATAPILVGLRRFQRANL